MPDDPAIRVTNLGKAYALFARPWNRLMFQLLRSRRHLLAETWVLRDVSFDVQRGETVGIIGRNGSGKSTLLQLICGTLCANEGQVQTRGRVAALLELGAGFNPEFTGRENVFLNACIHGLSRATVTERFDRIAAFADIGDYMDQPVKTYSTGMYLRLAFAVIAHVDADILIIDEALSVGDAFFQQKCMRFLRKFRETGTILFVSHDGAAVINLCERALWLEKGRIHAIGPAKQICEAYHASIVREAAPPASAIPILTPSLDTPISSESFGEGGAIITHVLLSDAHGNPLSTVNGGEHVTLRIHARASKKISRPILGFFIKDRLGQTLFGDNTFATHPYPAPIERDQPCEAAFTFEMPILLPAEYTIAAAIADGTASEHLMLHWIHDAALFTSTATAHHRGLVGIPMTSVRLQTHSPAHNH